MSTTTPMEDETSKVQFVRQIKRNDPNFPRSMVEGIIAAVSQHEMSCTEIIYISVRYEDVIFLKPSANIQDIKV